MDQDDKRKHREMKRELKRAGHKHRRQQLKRALTENPDEATADRDASFGRYSTASLNGVDRDATRRREIEASEDSNENPPGESSGGD